MLHSQLEDVRGRAAEAHGQQPTRPTALTDFGTFTVRRIPEASGAWVDFTLPTLAQEVITVLNGSTIGPGAILVRYSRQGELTSAAPSASRAVPNWMSRPSPSSTATAAAALSPAPAHAPYYCASTAAAA